MDTERLVNLGLPGGIVKAITILNQSGDLEAMAAFEAMFVRFCHDNYKFPDMTMHEEYRRAYPFQHIILEVKAQLYGVDYCIPDFREYMQ